MSNKAATISAAVPANVKAEAAAVAVAHGMSLAALVRDRLSPDSWRIYNRLSEFATAPEHPPRLGEALQRLVRQRIPDRLDRLAQRVNSRRRAASEGAAAPPENTP